MKDAVETWNPQPQKTGLYKLWEATEVESLWCQRITNDNYKYDIMFEYFGDSSDFRSKGCIVRAKSRSQSLSLSDNGVNYCNIWNVLNEMRNIDDSGLQNIVVEKEEYKNYNC